MCARPVYTRQVYPVKGEILSPTKGDFGRRLRRAREGAGITQAALGAKVGGFTQKAVSEWESGLAGPDIETLGQLAAVLATTVGWLVAGEGAPPDIRAKGQRVPRTKPQEKQA